MFWISMLGEHFPELTNEQVARIIERVRAVPLHPNGYEDVAREQMFLNATWDEMPQLGHNHPRMVALQQAIGCDNW